MSRGVDADGALPAWQVEEVQVLDLGRQPPDLAGKRREQRPPQGRLGIDEAVEGVASQHARLDRVEGHGGR